MCGELLENKEVLEILEKYKTQLENEFVGGLASKIDICIITNDSIKDNILKYHEVNDSFVDHIKTLSKEKQNRYFENIDVRKINRLSYENNVFILKGIANVNAIHNCLWFLYILFKDKMVNDSQLIYDILSSISIKDTLNLTDFEKTVIQELISYIRNNSNDINVENLEWKYLNFLLSMNDNGQLKIHRSMSENSSRFISCILGLCNKEYCGLEPDEDIAMKCLKILDSWRYVPGCNSDNVIDIEVFSNWFSDVKKLAIENNVLSIAMKYCGKVMFYTPKDKTGFFIDLNVANVLDQEDDSIRNGYRLEAINSRDFDYIDDSGHVEYSLATYYKDKQIKTEQKGLYRFASVFRKLSNMYYDYGMQIES